MNFFVFPLWPIVDGKCGCGNETCKDVGKHPRILWRNWEGFEVDESGACGIRTGGWFFVVDLDVKPGVDGLASISALGQDLPETLIVHTPSGGLHLYFQKPAGVYVPSRRAVLPGVDVRGEGGYVVGPGSPHRTGGVYVAEDASAEIADAPEWLLELVTAQKPAPANTHRTIDRDDPTANTWVRKYLASAEPAISGDGGSDVLFHICCDLMRSMLPLDRLADLVEEEYNARCIPPWTPTEIAHKLEDADGRSDATRGLPPEGFFESLLGRVPEPEPDPEATYEDNCARPNGETSKISLGNLIADLRYKKEWHGVLRYDDLHKWIVAKGGPIALDAHGGNMSDTDFIRMRAWFERNGKKTSKDDMFDAVITTATESKFNPILDYLDSLEPSDGEALSQLAEKALGNKTPLAQEAVVKTLVAAVRRMRRPGTKVDTVLVLRGKQGIRKSSFVTVLFGEEYTKSQMSDLSSKDASVGLRGMWGIELAELDRVLRAEPSTFKEFISRPVDSYRPPYSRMEEQFPRQCVFIGTTNDTRFLTDVTGNRRFWIIEVTGYNLEWLAEHRDEIWSAANALEAAGAPHWFEEDGSADALQEDYEFVDAWEPIVRDFCAGRTMVKSASQIYTDVIAKDDPNALARLDMRIQKRLMGILRKLGCENRRAGGKYWIDVPPSLTSEEPSEEEVARRKTAEVKSTMMLSLVKPAEPRP